MRQFHTEPLNYLAASLPGNPPPASPEGTVRLPSWSADRSMNSHPQEIERRQQCLHDSICPPGVRALPARRLD
jgi:hypothetical protein